MWIWAAHTGPETLKRWHLRSLYDNIQYRALKMSLSRLYMTNTNVPIHIGAVLPACAIWPWSHTKCYAFIGLVVFILDQLISVLFFYWCCIFVKFISIAIIMRYHFLLHYLLPWMCQVWKHYNSKDRKVNWMFNIK